MLKFLNPDMNWQTTLFDVTFKHFLWIFQWSLRNCITFDFVKSVYFLNSTYTIYCTLFSHNGSNATKALTRKRLQNREKGISRKLYDGNLTIKGRFSSLYVYIVLFLFLLTSWIVQRCTEALISICAIDKIRNNYKILCGTYLKSLEIHDR